MEGLDMMREMDEGSERRFWLTRADVVERIEACTGSSGGYMLRVWQSGPDPLLPKHVFPGQKRAVYDSRVLDRLLQPIRHDAESE
jgi:hypothetical protein